jgi:arylsulfatase A-like enzyme
VQTGTYRNAVSAYLAATAFADACVGRLLDALAAGPHANDTIVVLWSDNGYHLGEKFHWCKFTLWERSARCPFMILAPGITPAGAVCKRAVSFLDIYPTLIDLCGLPGKPALQGMSMAALLRDPAAAWPRPALTTNQRGNHALRSDDYRYIRYADGSEELYDLKVDVHEWRNLAGDPALEAVKRDFRRWLPANDAPDAPSEERPREEE